MGNLARSTTYSDAGVQANVQTVHQPQQQQPQIVQQPMMTPQVIHQPVQQQPIYSPPQMYQPQPQYQQPPYPQQHQPQQQWQQQNIVHVPMPQPVLPHHQPQYTPVAPPAPTQNMLEILREQQARSAPAVQQPPPAEPARLPIAKPSLLVTTRSKEEQQVINELSNTVATRPKENYLRKSDEPAKTSLIQINERSPPGDVSRWLEDKGFSYRVLELFEGQDGAALFSLNKSHLIQACGRDEGSRLYSQILVQKKRSNFQTATNAELNAILKMRKTHVEVTNTAPDNEPGLAVVS